MAAKETSILSMHYKGAFLFLIHLRETARKSKRRCSKYQREKSQKGLLSRQGSIRARILVPDDCMFLHVFYMLWKATLAYYHYYFSQTCRSSSLLKIHCVKSKCICFTPLIFIKAHVTWNYIFLNMSKYEFEMLFKLTRKTWFSTFAW